jgi:hypothetical protein
MTEPSDNAREPLLSTATYIHREYPIPDYNVNLPVEYYLIPEHTRESLAQYVKNGCAVGHFLSAVLANDLQDAFARADETHALCMKQIVRFVYNRIPSICHGSREKIAIWQQGGGALGRGWVQTDEGLTRWIQPKETANESA